MLPLRTVEWFFSTAPPGLRDIVLELRSLVQRAAPGAVEEIRRYGLVYYYPSRGGPVSGGVCQVYILDDNVCLGFIHGAFLPDPCGLLQGSRKAKRIIRLVSYEDAPWEALENLIAASARFDPHTLINKG